MSSRLLETSQKSVFCIHPWLLLALPLASQTQHDFSLPRCNRSQLRNDKVPWHPLSRFSNPFIGQQVVAPNFAIPLVFSRSVLSWSRKLRTGCLSISRTRQGIPMMGTKETKKFTNNFKAPRWRLRHAGRSHDSRRLRRGTMLLADNRLSAWKNSKPV